MLVGLAELSQILKTYHVAAENLEALDIDTTVEHALALALNPDQVFDVWHLFRTLVAQTQRYPLIVGDAGADRAFFSRYWYAQEQADGLIPAVPPDALLAAASHVDCARYLRDQAATSDEELAAAIEWERERTRQQFGTSPAREELHVLREQQRIRSLVDLERWLFQWERQTFGDTRALVAPDTSYLDWFDPKRTPSTLLLLPVHDGWSTLAYLHWYGALGGGTPLVMQFLKRWQRDYGAELVCHYGTMLQFFVERPPATPEAAFQLAWEQVALAECTTLLPGVAIRNHARALLTMKRWFIHERP